MSMWSVDILMRTPLNRSHTVFSDGTATVNSFFMIANSDEAGSVEA